MISEPNSQKRKLKSESCSKNTELIRKRTDFDEQDFMDEIMSEIDNVREDGLISDYDEFWNSPFKDTLRSVFDNEIESI